MELVKNSRVFFEPLSHTYLLDGDKELMGVTSLMKKHGLSANYAGISQEVLDAAAKVGTALHEEIENYDNKKVTVLTPLLKNYKKLCKENNLRFIANEYLISDNETIASSIDGVYKGSAPHTVILIDYKATEKVHKRPLSWQLGIYQYYFENQNPGTIVEACFCLHIDKKTHEVELIPIKPVTTKEVEALMEAEKNGLIYVDNYEEKRPDVSLILSKQEIKTYADGYAKVAKLKADIKKIEETIKACDAKVISYMQENGFEEMTSSSGTFKIKKGSVQLRVDSELLKTKHPKIYKACAKTVVVSPSLMFKANK